jgi:hypothetical protein
MEDMREKTISYRRAHWLNENPTVTLEKYVRNANQKLAALTDRWVLLGDQTVRLAKPKNAATGGLLLHLTTETEGEFASIVPKPMPTVTELDLKTQAPPNNAEWLDGDAFVYVADNHVCICTTAVPDSAIKHFFWEYFRKAKLTEEAHRFDLLKVADISKIKMLRTQGVKEVEIRASMFKASASYQKRKAQAISSLGSAVKHLKAIMGNANEVNPDAIRVCLTLKTDERAKGLVLGEKEIENIAADVVKNAEPGDEYVILTKSGQKITPHELFVRTKVEIERDGKTVRCADAWLELVKFFEEMKADGVLEE